MLNKFKARSGQMELMDAPNVPEELLIQNLRELDFLNRTLGGHAITLSGIKKLVTDRNKTYHIVDLGCGSGDSLRFIALWARKQKFKVILTGIDMNADTIHYLNYSSKKFPEIKGVVSDYRSFLMKAVDVDIIHCSLFCHHLKDKELEELLIAIKRQAKTGFIINDLQRNAPAYYSVKFFTQLFNGSPLAKNDGPISVLRGFKVEELNTLLRKAQIDNYSISRKWAFRYLIVGRTNL